MRNPKRIRKQEPKHSPADCGLRYPHRWHMFETPRGKFKVCDGEVNKRNNSTERG
jgi:hypothetical protein